MSYLTCANVAKTMGISNRRVQQMCKRGDFPGALKKGNTWMIPKENGLICYDIKKKPLPIGVSDFKTAVTDYYYVDKTLLIRDFLDMKPMVSLFTRPLQFGKSLNMDMMRVFFEKTSEDTSIYFKDKQIWSCGKSYTQHQGKYPVIFLTFKDVKCLTWNEAFQKFRNLLTLEFMRHDELASSSVLSVYEREQYHRIAGGNANEVDCQMGLQILSLLLHKHYNKECIIIIDEYDTPIQQGHKCNFCSEIVNFMQSFFSYGLKNNPHLAFGFLSGILYITKESIFGGMNKLKANSILDENYSKYFGFTVQEVKDMLHYYEKEDKFQEICNWYGSYRFGNTEIFNPWSVINYITDKCSPKVFAGSDEIIGEIIDAATPEIKENLWNLLCGEKITTYIDTNVIYPEIPNNLYSIYSFLLITGYLKVAAVYPQNDGNFMCDIAIPNKEISFVYKKEILNRANQNHVAISISQAIFSGDAQKLQSVLEDFMLESISSMNGTNEGFYHSMMLGLCAILGNRYQIRSNRDSVLGNFDIRLTPLVNGIPSFLFKFKHTNDNHMNLASLAESALRQIDEKKYDSKLQNTEIKSIVKIGIAFRGKDAVIKRIMNLHH